MTGAALKVVGSSSRGNAYALEAGGGILLLECGMPLREVKRAVGYRISEVRGCLLTHAHGDHAGRLREYLAAGITVCTNREAAEAAGGLPLAMPERRPFSLGGFTATPFYVPHDGTPCFAYVVEHEGMGRLLFATDFMYLPYTLRGWEISHFLIECNYDAGSPGRGDPNYLHRIRGHASLQTAAEIIRVNRTPALRSVVLCHVGSGADRGHFVEEMRKAAGAGAEVRCAEPGMCMGLCRDPF